ncbi:hypothetical protein B0H16DRAFT_74689 [Mycena metata]|uniref:Uncharacterized protein n=1 Tax=Mycena metata TaxID=1033252 RepID=A0AAD7NU66_9AGAR|nr:hypothetical protein B0H16DRAFT_74689 [Mycena metata]
MEYRWCSAFKSCGTAPMGQCTGIIPEILVFFVAVSLGILRFIVHSTDDRLKHPHVFALFLSLGLLLSLCIIYPLVFVYSRRSSRLAVLSNTMSGFKKSLVLGDTP